MKLTCIFSYLLLFPFILLAQKTDCACCSPEHQQFDFWIGDWEVFDTEGRKIGENIVQKLEDNCLVSENWKGAGGGTGKSFNYFDPEEQTWNQLWISNTGNILKLKGKAGKNRMVLKSPVSEGEKANFYNQISWTKNPDGSVTQIWELFNQNGEKIKTSFKGIYRKKK